MRQISVESERINHSFKVPSFRLEDLEIESFHDGVAAFSFDMNVLAANKAMRDIMPGSWLQEYPCTVEQVLSACTEEYEWVSHLVRERICYRNHVFNIARQGKVRSLLADSYLLRDEAGDVTGLCVFVKDIGNIVTLEKQVQHNEKLATVGKIAAGVAHEIRNPLTSIKGFLQMMRHELDTSGLKKEHHYANVMLNEIERINGLVGELLLLSKPRELKMEMIDVGEVLEKMEPLISSEALLHNIEFHLRVKPSPLVYGDRELLKQVFLNLIKNAIEAMEETGGGRLVLRTETLVDERMIRIDVQDSGPGIPHYMMDRIFDTFFTTKERGTGLGLPICQRLVNDIGGQIKVTSKGYGTTFSVHLPAVQE